MLKNDGFPRCESLCHVLNKSTSNIPRLPNYVEDSLGFDEFLTCKKCLYIWYDNKALKTT